MAHTFDPGHADRLDDVGRYRYCSRDELIDLLDADADSVVADLGSGTGFYAGDVAPYVDTLYGVDVQPSMHAAFAAKGLPPNVELVTAEAADLPLEDGAVDVTYSTMTFHEFTTPRAEVPDRIAAGDDFVGTGALGEVVRVLRPGGRFVAVDWSAAGEGDAGPSRGERHDVTSARRIVEAAGFTVDVARERPETFVLAATLPT